MRDPIVSVITPSYNQGRFLEDTLNSVKSQTYDNIEHIVVDGGSSDNSVEILEEYGDTYDLTWRSEEDEGQAHAIEKGFDLAEGDIHCWLNSDDIYLTKHAIELVITAFNQYSNVDVICGKGIHINQEGKWGTPIDRPDAQVSYEHIKYRHAILQPATFWRSHVSSNLSFDRSLKYAFDWDYFVSMFKQYNVLPINSYVAGYRMWGGNKTETGGIERARELREVTGRHIGRQSWQYALLGFYCAVLQGIKLLPAPLSTHVSSHVRSLSKIAKRLLDYRVTAI